jgi:hypothetical protein
VISRSVEVPLQLEQAAEEWKEYRYRLQTGRGRSATGAPVTGMTTRRIEGRVAFEEQDLGHTLVTLRREGDEGAGDAGALIEEVAMTLEGYLEFVLERR